MPPRSPAKAKNENVHTYMPRWRRTMRIAQKCETEEKTIRKTIHRRRRVRRASVFPSSSPHYCGTIYNFPRRLFIWRLQPKEFWKRKEDTNSYCSFSYSSSYSPPKTILSLFSFFIVMGEWSLAFFTSLLLDPKWTDQPRTCKEAGLPPSAHARCIIERWYFFSPLLLDSLSQSNRFGEMFVFFNVSPSFSFGYRSPHTTKTLHTIYLGPYGFTLHSIFFREVRHPSRQYNVKERKRFSVSVMPVFVALLWWRWLGGHYAIDTSLIDDFVFSSSRFCGACVCAGRGCCVWSHYNRFILWWRLWAFFLRFHSFHLWIYRLLYSLSLQTALWTGPFIWLRRLLLLYNRRCI